MDDVPYCKKQQEFEGMAMQGNGFTRAYFRATLVNDGQPVII